MSANLKLADLISVRVHIIPSVREDLGKIIASAWVEIQTPIGEFIARDFRILRSRRGGTLLVAPTLPNGDGYIAMLEMPACINQLILNEANREWAIYAQSHPEVRADASSNQNMTMLTRLKTKAVRR